MSRANRGPTDADITATYGFVNARFICGKCHCILAIQCNTDVVVELMTITMICRVRDNDLKVSLHIPAAADDRHHPLLPPDVTGLL